MTYVLVIALTWRGESGFEVEESCKEFTSTRETLILCARQMGGG